MTARDSGQTLETALIHDRPDLLVLDIGMPGEDGYTLMRRVRKLPAESGGAVPAISLTAHARAEDRARALDAGFHHHLPKPLDFPMLLAAIRELTARAVARA